MGLRFFVVPVHDSGAFEQELNGFLAAHKVVSIDRQLIEFVYTLVPTLRVGMLRVTLSVNSWGWCRWDAALGSSARTVLSDADHIARRIPNRRQPARAISRWGLNDFAARSTN